MSVQFAILLGYLGMGCELPAPSIVRIVFIVNKWHSIEIRVLRPTIAQQF